MTTRTPFIAFDTFALRDLIGRLSDNELRLYMLMSTYADGKTSRLWPGIVELSERSGMPAATVARTLQKLNLRGLFDYIRKDARDPDTGRAIANVYEICGPFLPADVIKSDSTRKHENRSTTIINNNQEQQSVKNNQEPPPPTTNPLRGPLVESVDFTALETALDQTQPAKSKKPKHQQKQDATEPTQKQGQDKSSNQGSAPVILSLRGSADFSPYHAPLPDIEREHLAATIEAHCETTAPVARAMADKFEPGAVLVALDEMSAAAAAGKIRSSKFGFVKWYLEHNAIAPDDIERIQRKQSMNALRDAYSAIDTKTGDTCSIISAWGGRYTMAYPDGEQYTFSENDALQRFKPQSMESAGAQ